MPVRTTLPMIGSLGLVAAFAIATISMPGSVVSGQSAKAPTAASGAGLKSKFVGTWKLVSIETRNAKGEVVPPAGPRATTPVGIIIYDASGYVAVSIMPAGRRKYVGLQPTSDEAKAAMDGYAAYFGTFSINEAEGVVTHQLQGSLNPAMAPAQKRGFELSGNRLTLKPPPGPTGTQSRLTWERIPDLPSLTAEHKKFVGFWKLISNERRTEKGDLVASNPGQFGYIIYTAAGHMMVHMVQPDRKKYAGDQPTPDEARETVRTYTNYFGPFYIHEADHYVVHDQIGTLNVGRNGPSPQQRFYEFSGKRLLLKPPVATVNDQNVQGTITWERAGDAGSTQ